MTFDWQKQISGWSAFSLSSHPCRASLWEGKTCHRYSHSLLHPSIPTFRHSPFSHFHSLCTLTPSFFYVKQPNRRRLKVSTSANFSSSILRSLTFILSTLFYSSKKKKCESVSKPQNSFECLERNILLLHYLSSVSMFMFRHASWQLFPLLFLPFAKSFIRSFTITHSPSSRFESIWSHFYWLFLTFLHFFWSDWFPLLTCSYFWLLVCSSSSVAAAALSSDFPVSRFCFVVHCSHSSPFESLSIVIFTHWPFHLNCSTLQ